MVLGVEGKDVRKVINVQCTGHVSGNVFICGEYFFSGEEEGVRNRKVINLHGYGSCIREFLYTNLGCYFFLMHRFMNVLEKLRFHKFHKKNFFFLIKAGRHHIFNIVIYCSNAAHNHRYICNKYKQKIFLFLSQAAKKGPKNPLTYVLKI